MTPPLVALVTCKEARHLDEDLPLLESAIRNRGGSVEIVEWRDAHVDWSAFDLAVVRSTWDYFCDLDGFLAWAERVDSATCLVNPLPALRWSADKRYLAELDAQGVPTVPTRFVAPGSAAAIGSDEDVVVKPAVAAGSTDALRFRAGDAAAAIKHAHEITSSGRVALIQPYQRAVDDRGETGLLFAGGEFSHAFCKAAILTGDDVAFVEGLYAAEDISPRVPTSAEHAIAKAALAAAPSESELAYARVDLIPGPAGEPLVLEVELVEPSLFLATDPASADRFARAIIDRMNASIESLAPTPVASPGGRVQGVGPGRRSGPP